MKDNAKKQLELFKEARAFMDEGYSLMREALNMGPLRLNREESIDVWRVTQQMIDDMVPALEAFIKSDLEDLMEEGQTSLTRKQIWRLYFMKKEGITNEDVQRQKEEEAEEQAAQEAEWQQRREQYHRELRLTAGAEAEYWRRVTPLYLKFGLYPPARKCTGFTANGSGCTASANRFTSEPTCSSHSVDGGWKIQKAQWEFFFGMTTGKFDSEFKRYIVPFRTATQLLYKELNKKEV